MWSYENYLAQMGGRRARQNPRGRYKRKTVTRRVTRRVTARKNGSFRHIDGMSLECSCNRNCLFQIGRRGVRKIRHDFNSKRYDEQNLILVNLIDTRTVLRYKTHRYHTMDNAMSKKRVCRLAFFKLFGISQQRLTTLMSKMIPGSPILHCDNRGKNPNSRHALDRERFIEIERHMSNYSYENPHYCNNNREREIVYLSAQHNMRTCYSNYTKEQRDNGKRSVSFSTFRKYVLKDTNICFKRPLRDTCQMCNFLAKNIKYSKTAMESGRYQNELTDHLLNAARHYSNLNFDFTVLAMKTADTENWRIPPVFTEKEQR